MNQQSERLRVEPIEGSRRVGNSFRARVTPPGAPGFFPVGISSYLDRDLTPLLPPQQIPFVPQGIVMSFYGIVGSFSSSHLWRAIPWDVGGGYDRYDKQGGIIPSSRWGFPGENRRISTRFPVKNIQAIRMEVREGIYPRHAPHMRIEGQQNVPPTRPGEHPTPGDMERKAAEPARPPSASIEGLEDEP
uniref:Photosystem I assembly protein Ycf4 n=2 Tax=Selaginella TaxID=3246 RepID=A0A650FH76_9TRAC|nr:photosystem I assembly protein Ycf4 [Selaginella sanguinolenta]QBL76361.1 photosystem I assembly protein Ycf4 [Selaginella sanguinolenta]QGU93193.1 photosystem I assembly protein Ycf4 [Selaginella rossii]